MKSIYDIDALDVHHLSISIASLIEKIENEKLRLTLTQQLNSIKEASVTPLEKFYTLLVFIDCERQNVLRYSQSDVTKSMTAILKQSLDKFSEVYFVNEESSTHEEINESLKLFTQQLTVEPEFFDSLDHQIFCYKWKVSGAMQDYSAWHSWIAELTPLLDQKNYARIFAHLAIIFDLDTRSKVIDSDDVNYNQDSSGPGVSQNSIRPTIDLKAEIEIWKPENMVKVLISYLQNYAHQVDHDIHLIDEKAREIRQHVLLPLLDGFINQARGKALLKAYSQGELNLQLTVFDSNVHELKIEAITPAVVLEIKQKESKHHEKLPSQPEPSPSFAKQHPVLMNTLKGMSIGLSAFAVVVGAGTLIYTTGGVGAVAIGAMVKAIGVGGTMASSAAVTLTPSSLMGAVLGVRKQSQEKEKDIQERKMHVATKKDEGAEQNYNLTYNQYFQKFFKKSKELSKDSTSSIKENREAGAQTLISIPNTIQHDNQNNLEKLIDPKDVKPFVELTGDFNMRP